MSQDRLKFYGRRKGRPLLKNRQQLVEDMMPQVGISLTETQIDPLTLFDKHPKECWLEIGFGAGEHLAYQAEQNPHVGLVGAEAFINGISSLLRHMRAKDLQNVRLYDGDVRLLLPKLKPGTFSRIFILFPDPWPKKRHHKRRLINGESLKTLHHLLAENGVLRIASDEASYQDWILEHVAASHLFHMPPGTIEDWKIPPQDWTPTRYQQKAIREGRIPLWLDFAKK